ncbi:PatB family C-S lyase [Clostridium sp. OS1-26]|uniref:MalY/PatB family protein n=1 Tax=Clostridium sp. OS1-26 TaxID=3070681 RepID=UPI0027E0ED54|nr:PatB family C-S lyase [Clostridium sp. OS1-26]WML32843.1 PatB family C-S lyase [Clostridium sp. OS1-26]
MKFDFDYEIKRTETNSIKWDTFSSEYIPLFIADMDFASSPAIIEAVEKRVSHGIFGYSKPSEELYDIILAWFKQEYNFDIKKSWILWLPGIVPALGVASAMIEGDVITTIPNYSMLLSAPKKAGKNRIDSSLKIINGRYEIDFDDLENKVTDKTKIFLLCNPHNPVGRVYTKEELLKVVEFCNKHDLILVSDEIHCELILEGRHTPIVTTGDIALERSITFMSPGKTYNIPGIPIAFAIIPNPELRKRFESAGYAIAHPGTLSYEACAAAYGKSGEWKQALIKYLRDNRDYLENELKRRFPKIFYTHVEGTYLIWLDFRPLGIENPYQFFYDNAKVVFSDGGQFGKEGFVRFNFGCRRAVLEKALNRIEEALKNRGEI